MECLCRLYQSFIVLVQSNLSGGKLFQCRCVGQRMILKICLLYKGILWTLEVSYAHNKYLQRTLIKIPAFCVILSCLNLLLNIGDIFWGDKSFFFVVQCVQLRIDMKLRIIWAGILMLTKKSGSHTAKIPIQFWNKKHKYQKFIYRISINWCHSREWHIYFLCFFLRIGFSKEQIKT